MSYKISKNPLRRFIGMQNTFGFHLTYYEIPQPLPCYCTETSLWILIHGFKNPEPLIISSVNNNVLN